MSRTNHYLVKRPHVYKLVIENLLLKVQELKRVHKRMLNCQVSNPRQELKRVPFSHRQELRAE